MPASPPADRLKLEAELPPELLRALHSLCRLLGIRPDRWHRVPSLARIFETAACAVLAEKIQAEGGRSWKDALVAASIRLDLNPDTIHSRLYRWPLEAYDQVA